jgi:hypothetical protein
MMYDTTWRTQLSCVTRLASFGALLFLLLGILPPDVPAQVATRTNAAAPVLDAVDREELSSLTTAQQQARQLATVLIGAREPSTIATPKTPLEVITEQTMRLGNRAIVPLFVSSGLEGRLVGGRQTFTSPVDYGPSTAKNDARRPLFIPASEEAMMALEILTK